MAVFREEEKGIKGLALSEERAGTSFPLLLDPEGKQTAAYSQDGFDTYIVDKQGIIRRRLQGIKVRRPTAEQILGELKSVAPDTDAKP